MRASCLDVVIWLGGPSRICAPFSESFARSSVRGSPDRRPRYSSGGTVLGWSVHSYSGFHLSSTGRLVRADGWWHARYEGYYETRSTAPRRSHLREVQESAETRACEKQLRCFNVGEAGACEKQPSSPAAFGLFNTIDIMVVAEQHFC